jgi:hypothetical protein
MKRAKEKITAMLNAITFAEAGDVDGAEQFLEASVATKGSQGETRSIPEAGARMDTTLLGTIETHMAAVAFAEAGDFRAARDYARSGGKSRAVLLVVEGNDPDEAALSYAMGLCERMDAHMEILLVMRKSTSAGDEEISFSLRQSIQVRLAPLVRELERSAVSFSLIICRGDIREKIYEIAQQHKDIRMVIYDSRKAREESAVNRGWHRMIENISRRLSVPLVVVSSKQPLEECL